LDSVRLAFSKGFRTSISCEPMLDGDIHAVVDAVRPFVSDTIWLGKAARLRQRTAANCPGDATVRERANELTHLQRDETIMALYYRYREDEMIRWKDSIKEVAGIQRPINRGLDV